MKFHENPSSRSRVPCGQADGKTVSVTKLIVKLCNFANASKNYCGGGVTVYSNIIYFTKPSLFQTTEHRMVG